MPERTTVILDDDVLRELDARADTGMGLGRSGVVRCDLSRYYQLLRRELPGLRETFTGRELLAIAGSMNGWASRMEPAEMLVGDIIAGENRFTVLAMQVQDSIALEGLADLHELDGPALVSKLQALSRGQTLALIDAVERWWADDERDTKAVL